MQNTFQLSTTIKAETASPDILVVSRTFLPKEGGIEEYVYNRCLQDPEKVIVLTAGYSGDQTFDQAQPFPVYRWSMPAYLPGGFIGGIIKQIINMVWSFALALKLYGRYRYRYIEWGHGFDFPSILLLSYLLPIRFFIYLHGNDAICPLHNPLLRSLFELTLTRAEGIVCNSSFTRDFLTTHFCFNTPTHIIHPVVRPEKFGEAITPDILDDLRWRVRQKFNIPETAIVILSVGRLVKRKGFDRVIENMSLLLASDFDVHYIICGRGAMEPKLKSLVSRLNMQERVHFAGYVPDRELAGYYAACDIFAMLTFFDANSSSIEGFGIVYAEAGYFGKPVIASRIGGVIDAVHHEENGILVNCLSGYEIFQAFQCLCSDPQLREQLGRKGQELAKRNFQSPIALHSQ